jgi:hypothetical protein
LEFRREKGDVILASVPPEPNVVIVGYYLLFVIDSTGRPSTGRFVQICQGRRRPPRPWFDADWFEWLRDMLRDGRRLTPGEMRALRRATLSPKAPPWRRPVSTEGHGPGDQGGGHGHNPDDQGGQGHDHGGHNHGGGHEGGHERGGGPEHGRGHHPKHEH